MDRTSADAIYHELKSTDEFMAFSIPVRLTYLFIPRGEKEARELLKNVHHVGILKLRNYETGKETHKLASAVNESLARKGYQDFMTIHDSGNQIQINVMEDSGRIRELVLLIASHEEFVYIQIKGKISLQNFVNFARNYQSRLS